jgi:polyisoprenoid-binding protein YceI
MNIVERGWRGPLCYAALSVAIAALAVAAVALPQDVAKKAAPAARGTAQTTIQAIGQATPQSSSAAAQEFELTLDPAQSSVHYSLDTTLHTVHGTFSLKRGAMTFNANGGKASGEFAAAATSGDSGNESRDKKMHTEILESQKYQEVVFRPDRLDGKVSSSGVSSVQLHGTFVLRGAEHELTVPVQEEIKGDHWKGTAKFSVPYIQWGLKNPSTFLLKANPAVDIEVELSGSVRAVK